VNERIVETSLDRISKYIYFYVSIPITTRRDDDDDSLNFSRFRMMMTRYIRGFGRRVARFTSINFRGLGGDDE